MVGGKGSCVGILSYILSTGRAFLGGLIKPPLVRQFLHGGHLYKEEEERDLSHFELFADLIFVAIVHVSQLLSIL
jgi:hypothetical protein